MTLAEDLVTAAAQAIRDAYDENCGLPVRDRPTLDVIEWMPEACAAVVAVLKRLATYRGDGPPVQWDFYARPDLVRLADEIEGGSRG